MIEKLKEHDIIDPKTNKVIGKIGCDLREIMDKLNELVDAVNGILAVQEEYRQAYAEDIVPMLTQQNEESDYITTTYTTDGKQKKYYGQNGAWVETDFPIPAGYIITIRESETKGGDNE